MAVYAVGDIQGCLKPLQIILNEIDFNPAVDRLWITGDIVNRGSHSLETLRFIYSIRYAIEIVLGNHDLHLLALAAGCRETNAFDTLQPILDAPDKDRLLDWLRHQPLLHHDKVLGYTMVHAGIPPQWSIKQSCGYADEVAAVLRSDNYQVFLQHMYGNQPDTWDDSFTGYTRLRVITNHFTRMRFCTADGKLDLKTKGVMDDPPQGCLPWFKHAGRKAHKENIIFGHWAALGGGVFEKNVFALDSGCVWGKELTVMRLGDNKMIKVPCNC
jgi:bis(5'-nucleosyl)-tetraphosphatase (symmetrical)